MFAIIRALVSRTCCACVHGNDRTLVGHWAVSQAVGIACSAGQFYANAGVPCPPNRALADHFVFSMNTDFKKVAQDFTSASADAGPADALSDMESFLPFLPDGVQPQAAGGGAAAADRSAMVAGDAERGIAALRDHFEASQRVRLLKREWVPGLRNATRCLFMQCTLADV